MEIECSNIQLKIYGVKTHYTETTFDGNNAKYQKKKYETPRISMLFYADTNVTFEHIGDIYTDLVNNFEVVGKNKIMLLQGEVQSFVIPKDIELIFQMTPIESPKSGTQK